MTSWSRGRRRRRRSIAKNGKHVKANDIPPQGVYLPNNNILAPHMKSPEYVQLSTAAAITLGIMGGRMYGCECTRCLNLLLTYPEGCRANCAYCGLARHREADRDYADRNFIRVDWPAVPMADIIDIVAKDPDEQPVSSHVHLDDHASALRRRHVHGARSNGPIASTPHAIPVSILSNPTTMTRDDVQRTRTWVPTFSRSRSMPRRRSCSIARAARACSRRTSGRSTGRSCWRRATFSGRRSLARTSSSAWARPSTKCSTLVQELVDLGGHSHMFCFFPEQGSLMDHLPATPRDQWRRVQLARYLIDYRDVRVEQMRFDEQGRVTDYGIAAAELADIIDEGIAFRTSGCPGKFQDDISACDRPYGDSPPSDIASYPFQPKKKDLKRIRKQLDIPVTLE